MLNQVVIVGRMTNNPEKRELEDGKQVTNMTLAVQRSYKNADGVYETDFVDCVLWNAIAENVAEYCHKGDVVGVKGRIQVSDYEKDGEKHRRTEVIAEKVTFLSSKSHDKEDEDEKEESKEEDLEM